MPEVEERALARVADFFAGAGSKARTFASLHDEREWFEGRLCLWAAGPKEVQEALVEASRTATSCRRTSARGWVGLRLDLPKTDWDEVAGVIEDAHAFILDR